MGSLRPAQIDFIQLRSYIHHVAINALELPRQFGGLELLARPFITALTKLLPQIVVLEQFNDCPCILPSPSAYKAGDVVLDNLSLRVGLLSLGGRNRHHWQSISHGFGDDNPKPFPDPGPVSKDV